MVKTRNDVCRFAEGVEDQIAGAVNICDVKRAIFRGFVSTTSNEAANARSLLNVRRHHTGWKVYLWLSSTLTEGYWRFLSKVDSDRSADIAMTLVGEL